MGFESAPNPYEGLDTLSLDELKNKVGELNLDQLTWLNAKLEQDKEANSKDMDDPQFKDYEMIGMAHDATHFVEGTLPGGHHIQLPEGVTLRQVPGTNTFDVVKTDGEVIVPSVHKEGTGPILVNGKTLEQLSLANSEISLKLEAVADAMKKESKTGMDVS